MSGWGGGRLRACRRGRSSRTVAFLVQDLFFHNHDPWKEDSYLPRTQTPFFSGLMDMFFLQIY